MFDSLFPKHWTTLQRLMWLKTNALARAVWEQITGNPVSFTAVSAPLKQLQIAFSPVQEGSGDPSPDNVRPISGWDGVTVEQRGKNLLALPIVPYNTVYPYSSINTFDPADYMWLKAGTYCLSYIADASNRYLFKLFDKNGNALQDDAYNPARGATYFNTTYKGWYTGTNLNAGAIQREIVLIEDCYVRICRSFGNPDISFTDCQFELGTTATDYVPYNPNSRSISISFGSTVYSGTVDVLTGVVTVTHQSVDLGSLNWFVGGTITQDIKRMATSDISRTIKRPETSGVLVDMMCEAYATINGNQVYSKITGIGSNSQGDISVYDPNYNTAESVADFTASVNGVKLVFPLATPITIQLTPQEVESLAGDNTMWSNANQPITVEYRKN